jgi:hypothetical protein
MTRFAVVDSENKVANVVIGDAPLNIEGQWIDLTGISPEPGIGWSYEGGVFAPPPPPPAPSALPPVITKIAMLTRLTDAEYVGILAAAKTDVEIEGWLGRFNAANTINLDDQRTKDGMALLVTKNLLTQARATAILTDPVQDNERP